MKKSQKHTSVGFAKPKDLKKPFDFCCDINHQDPDTQYNMRIPPFETSLTNVAPNKDGPDLKFRIQDIGKPGIYPTLRSGTHKAKSAASSGRCKRCRGPLRWYIEDEIALARDILAKEKEMKYMRDRKAQTRRRRAKLKRYKERKGLAKEREKDTDEEEEGSEEKK